MTVISNIANGFIGLFNAGGEQFMSWVTGIIPLVICLMTAVNALIGFIGVERVEKFCQKITKYTILRYTFCLLYTSFEVKRWKDEWKYTVARAEERHPVRLVSV